MMGTSEYNDVHRVMKYQVETETYVPLHILESKCCDKVCVILWNDFFIYLYEADQLSDKPIVYCAENAISNVYSVQNILLLRDSENILNFTIMRKRDGDKLMNKIQFRKIFENVLNVIIEDDKIIMLQHKDGQYLINLYNLIGTSKFKLHSRFVMNHNLIPTMNNVKLYTKPINYFSENFNNNILRIKNDGTVLDANILFVASDETVYYQILSDSNKTLSKMHSCSISINEIGFDDKICNKVYMSLITGSVVILTHGSDNTSVITTIHLNCCLEKIIIKNDYFLYSNGINMWKSSIDQHGMDSIKHRKFKFKNVYDIYFNSDYVYCTTLNNLIYVFNKNANYCFTSDEKHDDDDGYIKLSKSLKETISVFDEILEETKHNEDVINKIKIENNLIRIMALNHKPNLIMNCSFSSLQIYYDMKNINRATDNIILVNNIENYYKHDTLIYVVNYTISPEFRKVLKDIMTNVTDLWHLSVKLKFEKYIQTVCIKIVDDEFFSIAIPVPLNIVTIPATLDVKLISLIPNIHNENMHLWCLLPSKSIDVDVKYYLKSAPELNILKNCISSTETNIDTKILEIADKNTKLICDINNMTSIKSESNIPSCYIHVQGDIKLFAKAFVKWLNPYCAKNLSTKLSHDDFVLHNKNIKLTILNETVDICLISTDSKLKKIKISSTDVDISRQCYIFVRDILKKIVNENSTKSIPHFDFMRLQKIRDVTHSLLLSGNPDKMSLYNLSEEFNCDIIGIIPL